MTTSVVLLTNTSMEPFGEPAGTMAAFARTCPLGSFNVELVAGRLIGDGPAERNPREPDGTTVMFNEYARATVGIGQAWLGDAPDWYKG
jgi:hypothetical protein